MTDSGPHHSPSSSTPWPEKGPGGPMADSSADAPCPWQGSNRDQSWVAATPSLRLVARAILAEPARVRNRARGISGWSNQLADILKVFPGLEPNRASRRDAHFLAGPGVAADSAFPRLDLKHT